MSDVSASNSTCQKCISQFTKKEEAKRKRENNKNQPRIDQARTKASKIAKSTPKQMAALVKLCNDFSHDEIISNECSQFIVEGQRHLDQMSEIIQTVNGITPVQRVKQSICDVAERLDRICNLVKHIPQPDAESVTEDTSIQHKLNQIELMTKTLFAITSFKRD